MKKRIWGKVAGIVAAVVVAIGLAGCVEQQTAAALLAVAGTAAASFETFEGKTEAAATLQTDFTTFSGQVANWKSGTPTDELAEAGALVKSDLNLFPVSAKAQGLVDLIVDTVDAVLAAFPAPTASATITKANVTRSVAPTWTKAPKNANEFKKQYNTQAKTLGYPTI
jgi:hypothetical protein